MAKKRVYTYVEILWVCVQKELNTLLTMSLENGKNGNDFSDLIEYVVTFKVQYVYILVLFLLPTFIF